MESEIVSYEFLEGRAWFLEGINKNLIEENEILKQQAYNAKGYLYSDCLEQAEEKIKELTAENTALKSEIEVYLQNIQFHFENNSALAAENAVLREALKDMLSGWRYIRETHGDLYGVGWGRAQDKAEQALTNTNERAEKMLKVVEAAVRSVGDSDMDYEECYELIAKAVREYQEKQNGN